jgi:phage shock protein PspC (stress-responsive transcriptional regulator)
VTDSIPGEPPAAHTAAPSAAAPPPPPPPAAPPLARSLTDRRVAGVCGGLAAHLHVSAWLLRAGFIALTFVGGLGILLYIAGWILLPEEGSPQRFGWNSLVFTERHNTRLLVAFLVIAVAVIVFAGSVHAAHDGILWGVVLLGVGTFLLLQERREWNPNATAAASMPAAHAPYAAGTFTSLATETQTPPSAWARPARPRSILGIVTVAAALLAVGIAALLDSAGVVTVSVAACAAIALIVVGSGLLAGAWFGRSRGLIVLGALLIPFTATTALVDQPLSGGVGNVIEAPQSLAELHSQYHLAAGQLTVDLSQIPLGASPTVNVTVALGKLTVVLAPQANFYIAAHAGAGHIDILGAPDDGFNIDSPLSQSPSAGGGTLHLALSVGFGEIQVVDSTGTPVQGQ